jgi:uncharacterized protein YwqG
MRYDTRVDPNDPANQQLRVGQPLRTTDEMLAAFGDADHTRRQTKKPMHTRGAILRELIAHDLGHLEAKVMADIRPAVLICSERCEDDTSAPLGASRLGGDPDLPRDAMWPTSKGSPLTMLVQLRLSELPAEVRGSSIALPPRGMLWFWYLEPSDLESTCYGDLDGAYRVIFHPDETTPLVRRKTPEGLVRHHAAMPTMWAAPSFCDIDGLHAKEWDRYSSFCAEVQREGRSHSQLRGHHHAMYTDQDEGRPDDAELLLQLESEDNGPGWGWGDGGGLFFWIRKSELKKGDFSRVWGSIESG